MERTAALIADQDPCEGIDFVLSIDGIHKALWCEAWFGLGKAVLIPS